MARHAIQAALVAVALLGGCGGESVMNLAPVSTTGSLLTSVQNRRSVGGESETRFLQTAQVAADSYIWQPWFARVGGNVSLSYESEYGSSSRSTVIGSGSGTLSVLPLSRYPVTLSLAHTDSRVSGDFSGSDHTSDRAFLSARALITQSLRTGLTASWQRNSRADSGDLESKTLNLNLSKTFTREAAFLGINSIDVSASMRHSGFAASDPEEEGRSRLTGSLQIDTRSEPLKNVTIDSLVSATYDDLVEDTDDFTRRSLQGVSTVQWRPDDLPFIVTGSLRTLSEQTVRDGESDQPDSSTTLAAGSVGLRWPVNDRLSFNLGLQGSYQDVNRDQGGSLGEDDLDNGQRINATVLAGANYNSAPKDLSGFDWQWNLSGQTRDGLQSDEGFISDNSVSIGHRLNRMFDDLLFVPVRFSFSQQADFGYGVGEEDPLTVGAAHSVSLDYSGSSRSASTFARLFLRDSRVFVGEPREFQMLQGRIGRRISIDRERRLQGNVTAQATRDVADDSSDISVTASGNVSYAHRDLFEVENLGFRSELRLNVVDIDRVFGAGDDDFRTELVRNDWRNVLTYRIGRLTADFEATMFQRDVGFGYLALFRLRRDFGGGF